MPDCPPTPATRGYSRGGGSNLHGPRAAAAGAHDAPSQHEDEQASYVRRLCSEEAHFLDDTEAAGFQSRTAFDRETPKDVVDVWELRHLPCEALPTGRLLRFVNADAVILDTVGRDEAGNVTNSGLPYDELHAYAMAPKRVAGSSEPEAVTPLHMDVVAVEVRWQASGSSRPADVVCMRKLLACWLQHAAGCVRAGDAAFEDVLDCCAGLHAAALEAGIEC